MKYLNEAQTQERMTTVRPAPMQPPFSCRPRGRPGYSRANGLRIMWPTHYASEENPNDGCTLTSPARDQKVTDVSVTQGGKVEKKANPRTGEASEIVRHLQRYIVA